MLLWLAGIFLSMQAFAQGITVKGVVKDNTGMGVIGANILVKGTTNGTITDFDGNFTLEAKKGDVIVISFIGYKTQEVPAAATLNVTLQDDAEVLDDVVVIGYGSVKKNDATGSVTAIKPDELSKGITTNAQDMLTGKVAGVSVISNDGTPGGGAQIRIRGGSSLNASNDPLIVIDGLAIDNSGIKGMSNGLSMVNPEDIETFTVLKDASATAIYGSRGANGVIIVTTNREKKGRSIEYNGYVAIGKSANNLDVLTAGEWRQYVSDHNLTDAVDYGANTDWQKAIQQTAISHSHTLSFSSGGEDNGLRASMNYLRNEGIIKFSDLDRMSASLTAYQYGLNNRLKVELSLQANADKRHNVDKGIYSTIYNMNPTAPIYDENGNYLEQVGGRLTENNPVESHTERNDETTRKHLLGYGKVELSIIDGLKATTNLSYEYNSNQDYYYRPSYVYKVTDGGYAKRYNEEYTNKQLEVFLNYDKTFNKIHRIGAMVGYSYLDYSFETLKAERRKFDTDDFLWNNLGAGQDNRLEDVASSKSQAKLISFFARANYTLKDRYMLTATIRRDGSSRFGTNHKWGTFPSAAFAWRVNQENFLKDVSWIDNLKLRVSYGIVGNQNGIGNYTTLGLADNKGYEFGDVFQMGYLPGKELSNPNLKWEQSATANFGVDFSFFNGRLNGTVEYYNTHTKDLLVKRSLNASLGYTTMLDNLGKTKSSGIDLSLNGDVVRTKEFTWTLGTNFSMYKNEIVRIDDTLDENGKPASQVAQGWIIGEPINVYYDYLVDGIFQYDDFDITRDGTGNLVYTLKNTYDSNSDGVADSPIDYGGAIEPGMVKVRDNNGDGRITADDRVPIRKDPKFTVSLSSTWNWKGFDLFMDWYGVSGRKIKNSYLYDYNSGGSLRGKLNGVKVDYWTPFNPSNEFPRPSYSADPAYLSAIAIQDASYIRLRTLQLGYTFPVRLLKNTPIHKLRLYATATNLLTFTEFKSYSPELTPGSYPESRQYVFGVNVSF